MEKINFEIFKKRIIQILVFTPNPEDRENFQEHLHDLYIEYKEDLATYAYKVTLEEWAEEFLEPLHLKTHSYMLKSKAEKERDELIKQGYKFKLKP